MAKDKQTDPAALAGRMVDGWAYAVDLKGGGTVRLCDHDPPEAVWARVLAAKEAAKYVGTTTGPLGAPRPHPAKIADTYVRFSGARSEANGPVDGFGVVDAGEVLHLRNFGPSVIGAGSVEAKILELEQKFAADHALLGEVVDQVNEIEAELDAEADEGEEAAPPANGADALAAALAAGDTEDDGEAWVPPHLAVVPGAGAAPTGAAPTGEDDGEGD